MNKFNYEELEILKLLSDGVTKKEVEKELHLTEWQLRDRIYHMKLRCAANTDLHLIRIGFEEGYLKVNI